MKPTETSRPRGRPRRFDPEDAVAVARALFHARGYDAVSVADLTAAIGINPPSFYAAFGSKAALYARCLALYTDTAGIPFAEILTPGRPVAEALRALLEDAGGRYGAQPAAPGCLAIEGARCNDPDARQAACALTGEAERTIHDFVAITHPGAAARLADYVVTVLTGLSTMARQGHGADRLGRTASLAAAAIENALVGQAGAVRPASA